MIKDLGASPERQKVCEVSVMQNIQAPHSKTKSTAVCMMMGPGGANFLAVGGVFYTSESKKQSLDCAARRTTAPDVLKSFAVDQNKWGCAHFYCPG